MALMRAPDLTSETDLPGIEKIMRGGSRFKVSYAEFRTPKDLCGNVHA